MTEVERARFLDRGKECAFPANSQLWPHDAEPVVCFILEGVVSYSFNGEQAIKCTAGELFGVVNVYAPSDTVHFKAEAISDTKAYCWTREQFDLALGIYQELARDTIQTLSKRLRLVNDLLRERNLK